MYNEERQGRKTLSDEYEGSMYCLSCLVALFKLQCLLSVELCERIKTLGEVERIWKEMVPVGFTLLPRYSP
jgi:hypothetical protein